MNLGWRIGTHQSWAIKDRNEGKNKKKKIRLIFASPKAAAKNKRHGGSWRVMRGEAVSSDRLGSKEEVTAQRYCS